MMKILYARLNKIDLLRLIDVPTQFKLIIPYIQNERSQKQQCTCQDCRNGPTLLTFCKGGSRIDSSFITAEAVDAFRLHFFFASSSRYSHRLIAGSHLHNPAIIKF